MELEVIDLNEAQVDDIEARLEKYDNNHIKYKIPGRVSLGVQSGGELIAGADACMTVYKILYVSTVYVEDRYRGMGIGKMLMDRLEQRAASLGANMIRLDTFDWQGAEFYQKLDYEMVGGYKSEADGFCEYFFLKRI